MTSTRISLIQGPEGPEGPVGPAGPNTVPTQEAIADAISTPGTPAEEAVTANKRALDTADTADKNSPLRVGLDATYARGQQSGLEVNEDFSTYPDGPLTVTSTGKEWKSYPVSGARMPVVKSGWLTFNDPTTAFLGSYAQLMLDKDVTEFGYEVAFDQPLSGALTGGGLSCAAVMAQDAVAYWIAGGGGVPISPAHQTLAYDSFGLDVCTTTGGSVTGKINGLHLDNDLVVDGQTTYQVHVVLDKERGIAYYTMTDGSMITKADVAFKAGGRFVYWEPYKQALVGRATAKIRRVWADSRRNDHTVKALRDAARARRARTTFKASGADIAFTTSSVPITGLETTYTLGRSGDATVNLQGYVSVTTAGKFWFTVHDFAGTKLVERVIATAVGVYPVNITIPYTSGATTGNRIFLRMGIRADSGAGVLKMVTGSDVYGASISATPL